ncbi:MAG: complex I subunit 5 family protein [Halanaerobiaceae bacterium]
MSIIWLILIPLLTALLIPILNSYNKTLRNRFIILSAGLELGLAIFIFAFSFFSLKQDDLFLVYNLGNRSPFLTLNIALDSLGLIFVIMVALALFLIIIYSVTSREIKNEKEVSFYVLLFLVLSMMQGAVVTGNILNLFLFFEFMTVVSSPLIAYKLTQISTEAALKYLIYGLIGGIFFLLGIIFIWFNLNTLNMIEVANNFNQINFDIQITIIVCILLGLLIKLGIFPFHFWIPLAHSACPASISALLSGVILEVYLYIFARMFWYVIDFSILQQLGLGHFLLYLGLFSSMIGHIFALQADNVKRMLAFSSIGNIGIIVSVFSLNTELGLYAGLLHIISHLLMKSALFTGTGYLLKYSSGYNINDFKGVAYKQIGVFISCIMAMLGMIGLPPLIGFMSKWYILLAFLEENNYTGIFIVIVGSLISVIYYFRYVFSGFENISNKDKIESDSRDFYQKKVAVLSIYVFVFFIVFSGIFIKVLDIPLKAAINVLTG